jgi:FkbM family methyltransferase
LLARYLANIFIIFEDDFKGIKLLGFKKKINIIDIGASDGVAIKFISKTLGVNKVYAFEPDNDYYHKLKKLKIKNKKIYNYGISDKNQKLDIYVPIYKFFNKKFSLITYAFYNKEHLRKVLYKNFFFTKSLKIEKRVIFLKKIPNIKTKIDLIKIDVNGHELEIIKSLGKIIKKSKPVIITEEMSNIDLIKKFLKKFDYECCYYDYYNNKIETYKPKEKNPFNFYFINKNNTN